MEFDPFMSPRKEKMPFSKSRNSPVKQKSNCSTNLGRINWVAQPHKAATLLFTNLEKNSRKLKRIRGKCFHNWVDQALIDDFMFDQSDLIYKLGNSWKLNELVKLDQFTLDQLLSSFLLHDRSDTGKTFSIDWKFSKNIFVLKIVFRNVFPLLLWRLWK